MSDALRELGLKVLWDSIWIPNNESSPELWTDSPYQDEILSVRALPLKNNEIQIPDPKASRSMSRAALFLSSAYSLMKEHLAPYIERSPFRVGIYCAVENGPIDGPSTKEILHRSSDRYDLVFAEAYRKLRNPKMYLKQLPNLAPAQLGISLGIQGPMNVYTHSLYACQQALDQGEFDLVTGRVDASVILTAHAFDDFWIMKRSRVQDSRVLCEGAAYRLLIRNSDFDSDRAKQNLKLRKKREFYIDQENYFGISDPLINLIRKGN